jgi:heptosyltransferase-1
MKIAIVKLSALGDIIHSAFILQFIKKEFQDIQIDWIVEKGFAPILENNPDIDNIKTVELKSIKKSFFNIFREIKRVKEYAKEEYDLVIDLQGLTKSAITARLLCKNVAGFDKDSTREAIASLFYSKKINISYDENTIDRYRVLTSLALDFEITKESVLNKEPYLFYQDIESKFLDKEKKNIIFIVGSTWQSRIYPKEKLKIVADNLEANILIPYGNQSEYKDAKFLEEKCKNVTVLPKMSLNDLKAVISQVDLLIGNDTGPSYIAWANNIPSITLFGPTPPTRIYETKINRVLKSPSLVDHYKLDKNDFSIREIEEEQILKIAKELLDV